MTSTALVVIDLQGNGLQPDSERGITLMSGFAQLLDRSRRVVEAARERTMPVIFTQEWHRRDLSDIGRELDGSEGVHCLEDDPGTAIASDLGMLPSDYLIKKRRYSVFFGTDLQIILNGLNIDTLVLIGALTDVCVHYSFVDAHQLDYRCRVISDCVIGSSSAAHSAALDAMRYLQRSSVLTLDEFLTSPWDGQNDLAQIVKG